MLTWHDVLTYVRLFLRWWFVLALAVALAVGTAWYMLRQQPDIYLSQATLMVGNNFEVSAPTQAQVALSNVLADYYATLTRREVILAPVAERLQLTFPWQIIRDRMMLPALIVAPTCSKLRLPIPIRSAPLPSPTPLPRS